MEEGRYRVIRKLGAGGSGAVCLVWDKRLARYWGMKRIALETEEGRIAAEREIEILKGIRREGIPMLADVFYETDAVCLVMEYMEGESLEEKVRREGAMEETAAVGYALQLAETVGFLHGHAGLVHGDLKPMNVICHNGKLSLLDFGGADFLYRSNGKGEEGSFYTPGYGAPELTAGGAVSVRSDVYAFGAVFFYLLTGERPGACRGIYPVREQRPEISREAERLILTCTAADPRQRYGSMEEIAAQLQAMPKSLDGSGIWRKKKKDGGRLFRCVRNVLLTEGGTGSGRAALLLAAGILSGMAGMAVRAERKPDLLPVTIRTDAGDKLLIDFQSVYYTDEDPVFEVPLKYFQEGREYEVTIRQSERGGPAVRERTFVICAEAVKGQK